MSFLKSELKAAGPSEAALWEQGLCRCPPPAQCHHPRIVCCCLHAISKDKTKPVTPEFNFDLAVAGLKSHEDGQLDCKELIPPPPFSSPLFFFYSFSFQLAWFAAEKLGKQTENRPRPCGCCCLEDDAGDPAPLRPGEGCTIGALSSPSHVCGSVLCCRGSFLVFAASLKRLVVRSPTGCRGAVC